MNLSIVTSLYYSSPHLEAFCRAAGQAASAITADYEIILVNDGSPDDAAEIARRLSAGDARIRLVDLSRNFGHHRALLAGLAAATGAWVFLIDCDLEEDPALLRRFWDEVQVSPGVDVVYGIQAGRRKGGFFERVAGQFFYSIFDKISEIPYAANQLTARLMSRAYVKAVLEYPESEMDLWGIFSLAGYGQKALEVSKTSKGSTTYTLSRKIAMALQMITSFSTRPLLLILAAGAVITGASFIYILYLVVFRLVTQGVPSGWTSILVSIWFLGGMILSSIGVVGLYLSKVFLEVKRRPRYHVRNLSTEQPP